MGSLTSASIWDFEREKEAGETEKHFIEMKLTA